MGLPEPANELYAAVKAISPELWPPDDETAVTELGRAWRSASQAATDAATAVEASAQAVAAAWRDQAGANFGGRLTGGAQSLRRLSQGATQLADSADRYSRELINAKTIITETIAANLPVYLQAAGMVGGPLLQVQLARKIAGELNAMIAEKAAALHSAPPPAPQPPAPPATDEGNADEVAQVGDILASLSSAASVAALAPPATAIAAPIALVLGAGAMAAHSVAAFQKGDDPLAWVAVANDAMGLIPGGKAVYGAMSAVPPVERGMNAAMTMWSAGLQLPTAADLVSGGAVSNDLTGNGTLTQVIPNGINLVRSIK